MRKVLIKHFVLLTMIAVFSVAAIAQTTAFNFQGRLNDGGTAANGNYDLQFKLFDAIAGGNQINATVDRPNLMLINGVFSTTLDFGGLAFNTTGNRFLEIAVRPAGSPNAHVILGARQQILTVPFAARSASATQADNSTTATTANNSLSLGGVTASNYARLNFANQGDVVGANLGSNGYLSIQGNAFQPTNANGLVKVMLAVTANGTLARCYNGVTGSTSCDGFSVAMLNGGARISFPSSITVGNRFWLVNADISLIQGNDTDEYTASVGRTVTSPEILQVFLFKNGTRTNLPFHLFVF